MQSCSGTSQHPHRLRRISLTGHQSVDQAFVNTGGSKGRILSSIRRSRLKRHPDRLNAGGADSVSIWYCMVVVRHNRHCAESITLWIFVILHARDIAGRQHWDKRLTVRLGGLCHRKVYSLAPRRQFSESFDRANPDSICSRL